MTALRLGLRWAASAWLFRLSLAGFAVGVCAYAQMCTMPDYARGLVVEPRDLAAALPNPGTLVLAIPSPRFRLEHVPGAEPVPADFLTAPPPAASPESTSESEQAALQQFGRWLAANGAGPETEIVVYEEAHVPELAAYIAVLAAAAGFDGRAALLDGGLNAWRDAGYLLVPGSPRASVPPGHDGNTCSPTGPFVGLSDVLAARKDRTAAIVDGRPPSIYAGQDVEGPERAGHIPGAVNVPFSSVIGPDGKLLPGAQLRALFARAGVVAGKPVIVYCHTGRKAALVYIAARQAGLDASIYWGSWAEWSLHAELPAATGPGTTRDRPQSPP